MFLWFFNLHFRKQKIPQVMHLQNLGWTGQEGAGWPLRWGTHPAQIRMIDLKFLPLSRGAGRNVSWHHPAGEISGLMFACPRAHTEPGKGDFSLPFLCPLQFSWQIWQFLYLAVQRAAAAALGHREPQSRRCLRGSANLLP